MNSGFVDLFGYEHWREIRKASERGIFSWLVKKSVEIARKGIWDEVSRILVPVKGEAAVRSPDATKLSEIRRVLSCLNLIMLLFFQVSNTS